MIKRISKNKMYLKRSKKTLKKFARPQYLVYLLLLVLILGAAAYLFRTDWEHGHPRAGAFVSGRSDPADAYRNLDLSIASQASYSGSTLQNVRDLGMARGVEHRIFRFSVAKDNLVESGLLTLPTTPPPAAGYPVIVLCHGYVNPLYYSTEKAYLYDMEFYSRNGFAVVKPDFRGQGLSISDGTPAGAYYSMAYNTDVLSLIADIKQTKNLDKNNINIWGHSMGAYIALRAAVLSSDIKNAILLSGPVGYIQDMFRSYVAISDTNNSTAAANRAAQLAAHGTPLSNPGYWNKTSPINYLSRSKTFYQIHAGTNDKIVPPHFSADLDAALNRAGKAHEYFVYSGGDHGLWPLRPIIWQRSLDRLRAT
jgi:dipeptidyl aminopeptidase/acylaminoacyl peptidase